MNSVVEEGSFSSRTSPPRLFLSYRRADSSELTAQLAEQLRTDVGSRGVFRDEDDLIAGVPWSDRLDEAIDDCDVAMFVVGSQWAAERDDGSKRIEDPDDPVGSEVRRATADDSSCHAMPILVDVESPPTELPDDVLRLFDRHAVRTTTAELSGGNSPGYQRILVGIWEAMRQRTPRGVLVIGDEQGIAQLDAVVDEMRSSKLIDARRLSRFASGACVVSARRVRRGAKRWPDVIVVVPEAMPSDALRARLEAIDEHPGIRNVSLVGAGIGAGFAIATVLGSQGALSSTTTFAASTQVAPVVPQIGTGPIGAISSGWAHASRAARTTVAAAIVGGSVAVAVAPFPSGDAFASEAEWSDLTWQFDGLTEPVVEDESGSARIVSTNLTLTNPLTDEESVLPVDSVSLRSESGEFFVATGAQNLRDDSWDGSFELGPRSTGEWRLDFDVPASIEKGELSIELGRPPDRRAIIGPNGTYVEDDVVEVVLATTSWNGPYSMNSAELVLTGAFASTTAGQYEDGRARPAFDFGQDRQADEGQVFVHLDFEITEISTSSIIGINIHQFRIAADGSAQLCETDGSGANAETVSFSATCPVPVDAEQLLLEIGTDSCVGGCREWTWTSEIDAAFLEAFQ